VKFINLILIVSALLKAAWTDNPIAVGSVSFQDAIWDDSDNILYSKQKVNNLTKDGKAVVLYLFESCFS
jgi:hypothetical protein